MPDMEWSDHDKAEYLMCFTYEPERQDECCGASGRKMRRVCIYCPNFERYRKRKQQEEKQKREDEQNEKDH